MATRGFAAGDTIEGKYRLVRQLGEGGIGTVWIGWQDLVQRDIAVKFLKGELEAEQRQRFLLEARALGRLNHPNCITIYDFGYSEPHGALFLVMEYLQGEPLSDWRGRGMPAGDVIEISKQIANALAYAHHQGVYHRDLKPENVMLVPTFTGETLVKVLDFGLARLGSHAEDDRLTKTGEIFGTPAYMSPEQIRGTRNAGPASDIYSLGIMMYEMIERRLPFDNMPSFDLMMAHVTKPIPPFRRDVPPDLAKIVLKCLEKDPARRYATALDLWKALSGLVVGLEEDSSMAFVVVDAPDKTLEGTPPAPYDPSDFESTLEEDSGKKQRLQLPDAAASGATPVMETVLMHSMPEQRTITAVTSPVGPNFEWKYALTVGLLGFAVVLATLFIVLSDDEEANAQAPDPVAELPNNQPESEPQQTTGDAVAVSGPNAEKEKPVETSTKVEVEDEPAEEPERPKATKKQPRKQKPKSQKSTKKKSTKTQSTPKLDFDSVSLDGKTNPAPTKTKKDSGGNPTFESQRLEP